MQIIDYSLEIGYVVDRLQRERDAVTLYLSDLGPDTRGFLRTRFDNTDKAIVAIRSWPKSNLEKIIQDDLKYEWRCDRE